MDGPRRSLITEATREIGEPNARTRPFARASDARHRVSGAGRGAWHTPGVSSSADAGRRDPVFPTRTHGACLPTPFPLPALLPTAPWVVNTSTTSKKIRSLHYGRAMNLLRSSGLARGDRYEVIQQLETLHPPHLRGEADNAFDEAACPWPDTPPDPSTFGFITGP